MAGRRRRKRLKLQDYQPTYSDLPVEILELILSQLNLRDNICASAVCKSWLAVATAVRKPNHPPWLMFVPKFGYLYEFYDPSNRKTYWFEFPELYGSRICYSKDGWLLLFRPLTRCVFFFSPYTRELINLPKQHISDQIVAFSAPPTSSSCIVVAVRSMTPLVAVSTCCPGDTEWNRVTYYNQVPFNIGIWNKIVFSKGLFYCLSLTGRLGVYDPEKGTWSVSSVPSPKCTSWRTRFMAENNGDIFAMHTYTNVIPRIYKLDEKREKWMEVDTLGGITLFANSLSSITRTDVHGKMRNMVYFCKVLFYGKRCVSYSPETGRYYPRNQNYDWGNKDSCQRFWIDAPEDLSTIIRR